MTITALALPLSRNFYSRYEPARSIVRVNISQTGGVTGEVITTVVKRKTMGEDLVLATNETILGATPATAFTVTFPLTAMKDADGFSTARVSRTLGDYTIRVTAGAVEAESLFTVTPITPESMKSSYLKGIPLTNFAGVELSDEDIVEEVLRNYAHVTTMMQGELEPATITTEKVLSSPSAPASYDLIGEPVGFFRQENTARWLSLQIPYHNVRKVHALSGWFNQNKAVDITADWQVTIAQNGLVQMVPSNGAVLNWQFFGVGGQAFLMNRESVPNFWNYYALIGLREIPLEILQFIAKRTAMSLLTTVGATASSAMYAPGVTSASISRDGVTENRSFNPKGIYSALTDQYSHDTGRQDDGKEVMISKLRQKYMGITMIVL